MSNVIEALKVLRKDLIVLSVATWLHGMGPFQAPSFETPVLTQRLSTLLLSSWEMVVMTLCWSNTDVALVAAVPQTEIIT